MYRYMYADFFSVLVTYMPFIFGLYRLRFFNDRWAFRAIFSYTKRRRTFTLRQSPPTSERLRRETLYVVLVL